MRKIKETTFKNKVKAFLERNNLDIDNEKSTLKRGKDCDEILKLKELALYYQRFYPEQGRQKCTCQQNITDFINILKIYTKKNFPETEEE